MKKTSPILTFKKVDAIYRSCLSRVGKEETLAIQAFQRVAFFSPKRLEKSRAKIEALLAELPEGFKASSEDGCMSFLNARMDKHGCWWTESYEYVEQLFALGMGIGKVKLLLPLRLRHLLPDGLPYYVIS